MVSEHSFSLFNRSILLWVRLRIFSWIWTLFAFLFLGLNWSYLLLFLLFGMFVFSVFMNSLWICEINSLFMIWVAGIFKLVYNCPGLPWYSEGKKSACNVEDLGLIPGLDRSPGGGHGNPLSILAWRIPMDKGAWRAAIHGVIKQITSPGWMHETSAQGWCTGKTQRDQVGAGGGRGDRDGECM